ncbi:MAG: hypothetical protein R3E79_31120 [Caldilineaceae bacterium]
MIIREDDRIIREDDLEFNFSNAINKPIKFDDSSHSLSHCMKAVDFVVELADAYLFVEVKDPSHPKAPAQNIHNFKGKITSGELKDEIVKIFRDTFVYRWAEDKLEKPVYFLALVTIDEPLLNNFQTELHQHLPFRGPKRWLRKIAVSCHVVNIEAWNRNYPKWPVRRLSEK